MSASNDRRKRAEARVAGTDRKTNMSAEEIKKQKKEQVQLDLWFHSRWPAGRGHHYSQHQPVLHRHHRRADRRSVYNTAQFSYYYKTQYYNFVQNYGSYASMLGTGHQLPAEEADLQHAAATAAAGTITSSSRPCP
jgi:hypothetical protein